MQGRTATPFHLRPLQVGDLGGAQPMPIGDQDQRGITLAITATLGDGDQLIDLGRRQVFPRSQLGVGPPDRNCPI